MTPRFDHSVSTQGPAERLWRCPRCNLTVRRVRQPEPCEDHPFDQMVTDKDGATR